MSSEASLSKELSDLTSYLAMDAWLGLDWRALASTPSTYPLGTTRDCWKELTGTVPVVIVERAFTGR